MSNYLSKSEWEGGSEAFDEANQTKISFCRTHDLTLSVLVLVDKFNKSSPNLIPVKIASSKPPLAILRLHHGHSLEIVSQDALLTLLNDAAS